MFESSLYIIDVAHFKIDGLEIFFPRSVAYLFILLKGSFAEQNFLIVAVFLFSYYVICKGEVLNYSEVQLIVFFYG